MRVTNFSGSSGDGGEPGPFGEAPSGRARSAVSTSLPGRARSVAAPSVPFQPGATIGLLKVDECSADRFVLSMRSGLLIATSFFGGLLSILGLWMLELILSRLESSVSIGEILNKETFLLMMSPIFASIGFVLAVSPFFLGFRMVFDRPSRCLTIRGGLHGWVQTWTADELDGMHCRVYSLEYLTTVHYSQIIVTDRNFSCIAAFGLSGLSIVGAKNADGLARAAVHAAAIFGVSLYLDTRMAQGTVVEKFIETVRSSPLYARGREAPRVGYPISSHKTITHAASASGCAGMVALLVFAILKLLP